MFENVFKKGGKVDNDDKIFENILKRINKNVFSERASGDFTRKSNNSILFKTLNIFSLVLESLLHDDKIVKIKYKFYYFSSKSSKFLSFSKINYCF